VDAICPNCSRNNDKNDRGQKLLDGNKSPRHIDKYIDNPHLHEHGTEKSRLTRSKSGSFHDFENVLAVTQFAQSPVICFVLLIALSFHSIVAGMALGIAENAFESLLIAILAHKGFAAFALSHSFVQSRNEEGSMTFSNCQIAGWMGFFACTTPVGILIGTGIRTEIDNTTTAVLTAVASGTFLFVGIVEIASKEVRRPKLSLSHTHTHTHTHTNYDPNNHTSQLEEHGKQVGGPFIICKIFMISFGFALMALLANWT
jgi:hypothetical protein